MALHQAAGGHMHVQQHMLKREVVGNPANCVVPQVCSALVKSSSEISSYQLSNQTGLHLLTCGLRMACCVTQLPPSQCNTSCSNSY
jgi:hypothetical protein